MQRRRALSIEHLGPKICNQLPNDMPRSVGERIIENPQYSTGESPTLKYPQVIDWLKEHPVDPSTELLAQIERTNYTVLVGLSGGGRNVHIERLCELYPDIYAQSISVTTRPFRYNVKRGVWERQGTSYLHHSVEHVIGEIMDGNFFEWEDIHGQQVSGTHIDSLSSIPDGVTAINETEPGGSSKIFEYTGRPSVFLLPEPFDAWLGNRMSDLPHAEQVRRLDTARRNLRVALDNPYYAFFCKTIVPDDQHEAALTESAHKLHQLISTLNSGGMEEYMKHYDAEDARAREIAQGYINRIDGFLAAA